MANLTANSPNYPLETDELLPGINGTTGTIYQGTLLVYDSNGYMVPATEATGLIYAGQAIKQWDNLSGAAGGATMESSFRPGGADIDTAVGGIFDQTWVGHLVYLKDDHTVSKDSTGRSVAGRLIAVKNGKAYFDPHIRA